jgi:hypothetical protein
MNSLIGIGILFLVCLVAVIATIVYKTRQSGASTNDNPESLKFNTDGTVSMVKSNKEYFTFIENERGIKYTKDDPLHLRYFTNKATRGSIWNGMKNTQDDMVNTPCDAPDCVFVNTADRASTTVLLNDVMDSMKPGLKDYRTYLNSKGLTTAIYKQNSIANEALRDKFEFDILFKGYLEYKGITVPGDLTNNNHKESDFFKDIIKRFPIIQRWRFIHQMLMGLMVLKEKGDGKIAMYSSTGQNGTGDLIELTIGTDIDLFVSLTFIGIIKILVEDKDIGGVLYDPPADILSYKQILANREKIMKINVSEDKNSPQTLN